MLASWLSSTRYPRHRRRRRLYHRAAPLQARRAAEERRHQETEAANKWNHFQSKSVSRTSPELALELRDH